MYSYEKPLAREDVFVGFYNASDHAAYQSITEKLDAVSEKYRFTFREFQRAEMDNLHIEKQYQLTHFIILSDASLKECVERYGHLTRQFDNLSLAIVYPSDEEFFASGKIVDQVKQSFDGKINCLRPNENQDGKHFVSVEKIVDNAVCDSVRIKYIPHCKGESIDQLQKEYYPFFKTAGEVYTNLHLYHRSVTDGFFAIRAPGGFLITATKTDKAKMEMRRTVFVHSYNPNTNVLEYSGPYLPSSDVVEASIVFANVPAVNAIIHTHASTLFTRNPQFADRILVPKLSYGEAELGYMIAKIIPDYLDEYIIMEDHGEVFAITDIADLKTPAKHVEAICLDAMKQCESLELATI